MGPSSLAPARSSLLACPQGLDLYMRALQLTSPEKAPQGFKEDTSCMRNQPPGMNDNTTDVTKNSPNRDEMRSQPERVPCPPDPLHNSSFPALSLNTKGLSSSGFCPCSSPMPISQELAFCLHSFSPGYPLLLPPSYLFTPGVLLSAQCLHFFMLPRDTSYPTMAPPCLLMTTNETAPHLAFEETQLPYLGALQASGQTLYSQAQAPGSRAALSSSSGPERAGVMTQAKWAMPSSRAGITALPYPLKKENGKIRYECNVCAKSFGQLSNLKVHLRVHSGERPFQCALCQKNFTQLAHLQKHHLVHTGERPFQCLMCHRRFSSSSNLKSHLRLHPRAQPFQPSVCKSLPAPAPRGQALPVQCLQESLWPGPPLSPALPSGTKERWILWQSHQRSRRAGMWTRLKHPQYFRESEDSWSE